MPQTLMSVVELSSGSIWAPRPEEPPYLVAEVGNPWPTDATAYVVFYDTAGSELATIDGDVAADAITFLADPTDVDGIPAGANFQIFLDTSDGPRKIRYGKVIRREATFPDAPVIQYASVALKYLDYFPTLGLRSNWKAIDGRAQVYDNSGSLPNSVAQNFTLFTKAAIRWDAPANSDTVQVRVQLLNSGGGQTAVMLCADQRLTSGLCVIFESSDAVFLHDKIHLATVAGPYALTDKITPVSHTVVSLNEYIIQYSDITRVFAVYASTNLATPLASWTDTTGIVTHGPGYRYFGFSWQASLLATGAQVCAFEAKDN